MRAIEPPGPNWLPAAEAARRIARRELSCEELVASCLARIDAREGQVQAWEHVAAQPSLARARALDREAPRGPLHGVPVGIKDIIDTADQPTAYGSPIYRGHQPRADASCVSLLRRAGCVILGKTVTAEFANNHPGKTRNPRNLAHTPGGSSSGSAAAVADGMVPVALGTQMGGSIIRPAAYCGVLGFKPTFGLVNRAGTKSISESLDTIGVFARDPQDIALVLQALTGLAPPAHDAHAHRAPRIGLLRTARWRQADPCVQDAVLQAAARLAAAGATVSEASLGEDDAALDAAAACIMAYETARALAWEQEHHAHDLSDTLRPRLAEGWTIPRQQYDGALRLAAEGRRRFAARMASCDFLLTPAVAGEALPGLASTGNSAFARLWSLVGTPCMSVPCGTGPSGLPLAVQLVGAAGADMDLVRWTGWVLSVLSS